MTPSKSEIDNTIKGLELREHPLTLARELIEDFRASREREGIQSHDFYPPEMLWEVFKAPVIRPNFTLASVLYPKSR